MAAASTPRPWGPSQRAVRATIAKVPTSDPTRPVLAAVISLHSVPSEILSGRNHAADRAASQRSSCSAPQFVTMFRGNSSWGLRFVAGAGRLETALRNPISRMS